MYNVLGDSMHLNKKVYKFKSNKDVSIKIVQISDIHFSIDYKLKRLDKVKNKIDIIDPDVVCIIGDLIDSYHDSNIDVFKKWLVELSDKYKVIVVLGNHDYLAYNNGKYVEHTDISWIKDIESSNLIILNGIYRYKNVNFIGYNIDFDYYYHHNYERFKESDYIKYNKELSDLMSNISDDYNVLLVHDPSLFLNIDNYKKIDGFDKIDLVLCGHTHGGLIPSFIPGNFGLVSPSKELFPSKVRGRVRISNANLIISSGVVKLSRKSRLSSFNDIYGYNINVICVNK